MKASQDHTRRSLASSLLIVCLFILIYFPELSDLMSIWASNEDYGHGFFILPLTIYLIWRKKAELSVLPSEPSAWGIVLVGVWTVLYGAGMIGHISTITNLSMVIFPIAAVATLFSGRAAIMILGPVVFMVFMFPIPSEVYTRVTNPLLLISTTMSFHMLVLFHVPVFQDGNLLTLPHYTMEVVQACSGIRSLLSIMALAFLMGSLMMTNRVLGVVFFLTSVPVAILGNVLRITLTAFLAYHISPRAAEGFAHTLAGIVTFAFSFLLLFGCMEFILWLSRKNEPSPSS